MSKRKTLEKYTKLLAKIDRKMLYYQKTWHHLLKRKNKLLQMKWREEADEAS